ncbi:hypothetical protein PsorP6_011075 [Peronosclerospora sorghi]|uniref:Uncharacterized protein n=1 Tax=Peronosclerospora sorghi TaxID=230839 RepID=A0ACC0VW00_9STRA|nr:hypothetical protein PsorP6_011075 [Peronosclerospora sorghi]
MHKTTTSALTTVLYDMSKKQTTRRTFNGDDASAHQLPIRAFNIPLCQLHQLGDTFNTKHAASVRLDKIAKARREIS